MYTTRKQRGKVLLHDALFEFKFTVYHVSSYRYGLCTSFISYLTWLAVSFAVHTKTNQGDEQHNNCHTYYN